MKVNLVILSEVSRTNEIEGSGLLTQNDPDPSTSSNSARDDR